MKLIYIEIAFQHHTISYVYVIHWQEKMFFGEKTWDNIEKKTPNDRKW